MLYDIAIIIIRRMKTQIGPSSTLVYTRTAELGRNAWRKHLDSLNQDEEKRLPDSRPSMHAIKKMTLSIRPVDIHKPTLRYKEVFIMTFYRIGECCSSAL